MICSSCGRQIVDHAKFCPYCGSPQKKIPEVQPKPEPTRPESTNPEPLKPEAPKQQDLKASKKKKKPWIIGLVCIVLLLIVGIGAAVTFTMLRGNEVDRDEIQILTEDFSEIEVTNANTAAQAAADASEKLNYTNALSELSGITDWTIGGKKYYFLQQYYQGVPVYDRYATLVVDAEGKAVSLITDTYDISEDTNLNASVSSQVVEEKILEYASENWNEVLDNIKIADLNENSRVLYDKNILDGARLAYQLKVTNKKAYELIVDAESGKVLEEVEANADGPAYIKKTANGIEVIDTPVPELRKNFSIYAYDKQGDLYPNYKVEIYKNSSGSDEWELVGEYEGDANGAVEVTKLRRGAYYIALTDLGSGEIRETKKVRIKKNADTESLAFEEFGADYKLAPDAALSVVTKRAGRDTEVTNYTMEARALWDSSEYEAIDPNNRMHLEEGNYYRIRLAQYDMSARKTRYRSFTVQIAEGEAENLSILRYFLPDQSLSFSQDTYRVDADKTVELSVDSENIDGSITYRSSDGSIATVNSKTGLVTGRKEGSVTITATSETVSATCTVYVDAWIGFQRNEYSVEADQTITVNALLHGCATNQSTWTIADSQIARIENTSSDTVTIKGLKEGTTTLTINCGNATASCQINVSGGLEDKVYAALEGHTYQTASSAGFDNYITFAADGKKTYRITGNTLLSTESILEIGEDTSGDYQYYMKISGTYSTYYYRFNIEGDEVYGLDFWTRDGGTWDGYSGSSSLSSMIIIGLHS